jgi:putative transposase
VHKPLAKAIKTLILPLLDANTGKQAALESTEALFTDMVRFYREILPTHPAFWDKVVKVDSQTDEILSEQVPTNKDILTRLEFATVSTATHPVPTHPLSVLPGADDAPVVFRRAAINRAIGLAKSYRTHRKRWEALPTHRRGKAPAVPTVRAMPVTLYQGMAL